MSRGGRGGGGFGGRGGRGGGGGGAPGGGGPFGGDDLKPDYSVTELFPPIVPPVQNPPSKAERAIVSRYRHHREKIHSGPLYTVMARKRGMEDPFNDVVRYSMKYAKRVRRAPKLDARPYVIGFFPEELWVTLGVDGENAAVGEGGKALAKKRLAFEALDSAHWEGGEEEDEVEGGKKEDEEKEEGEDEEEEEKDHFSDDDNDDYNAEQYFENGDDMSDGYGDDDGGGEDYY
ncbi:DNA-directed RNA polymerase III, subunit Rpc31 [Tricharina praecox]|uniref:DNA-directed RNA polymerase III, subunit Rpc31 n=1 Tax=Tricharina praecox TaxID=43433 RepID=UPI00221EDF39|nr:DNA-directed RNA polymerase III, subunit Rpc31 [Tricharina praecox]KAI5856479.1 DNA-directed RNA polymerase III, subunit Rpc31 [Tricharina praecox]